MWGNLDFSALGLGFSLGGAEIRVLNAKREVFFESFPGHIHGFYELHYVFGGRGELDCLGRRIPLGEGILYLCGPHVSHEQLTDPADNMMEYSFSFDVIRSGKKAPSIVSPLEGVKLWIGEDRRRIGEIFSVMEQEIAAGEAGAAEALESLCRLLLIQVIRNFEGPGKTSEEARRTTEDRRKFLMDEAFIYRFRDMTLSSLAALLNLSERQTLRNVREYYGMSFVEFRAKSRLNAAAKILREKPDLSVTDAAELVGFSSAAHFRKLFQKEYGMSPSEWRSRQKKE